MKKLFITLLLTLAAITTAMAYDFEEDGIYYNISSNTEVTVTYKSFDWYSPANSYPGDVVIPETVTHDGNTYTVTAIGYMAFWGSSVTSVVIPNTVKRIGAKAFYERSSLRSLTLSDSLESIGEAAFSGCRFLEIDLVIPNSVTMIGPEAFKSCFFLKSLTIGNSIKSLPQGVFWGCNVKSITIPDNVEYIGAEAFYSCDDLINLTIGNSVQTIGEEAFLGCNSLTDLSIPKSVTSIGNHAFSGCSGLTTVTVEEGNPVYDSRDNCNAIIETSSNKLIFGCQSTIIPNSVITIGSYAFRWCYALEGIDIPNSVVTIESHAFYCCYSLAYVNFGNSVKFINYEAFTCCKSLRSLNLPASVKTITENPFSGCGSLTSISVDPNNPYYDSRDNCNAIIETANDYLVRGCVNSIIPNSITSIGIYAFSPCEGLTDIIIPEHVSLIEPSAFSGCSDLMNVTCLATTPPEIWYGNPFDANTREQGILYVPGKSYAAYMRANVWKTFSHIHGIGDVPGDMNGDSELTITDVIELINCLLNGEEESVALEIADVNGDGVVNITDVTALINLLKGDQP